MIGREEERTAIEAFLKVPACLGLFGLIGLAVFRSKVDGFVLGLQPVHLKLVGQAK